MQEAHPKCVIPILSAQGAEAPAYATSGASGADVRAFISADRIIQPGETALIPTGLTFAIPHGYEIQVRPRSGMALKHGITVLNTPGTIDADYRGELQVILINHSKVPFTVTPGMRIAQIVVAPVIQAEFCVEDALSTTSRSINGFGHTGVH